MDIRDIFRQYSMDSYEVQSIRATLREIEERHRSSFETDLVRRAIEEHADAARALVPSLSAELGTFESRFSEYAREAAENIGWLETSSLRAALEDFGGTSRLYFSSLAEQLSAQNSALRGIEDNYVSQNFAATLLGLGEQAKYIGEFSYEVSEGDAQADVVEEEQIAPEVAAQLIEVNFFPIRLFEQLRRSPELMKGLEDREFEEFCAELLAQMGFENVILTPRSGDGGRDIVAVKSIHNIPLLLAFECKRYRDSRKIGMAIMRSLLGSVVHRHTMANKGVLLTTSSFTSGSRTFIAHEPRVDGKDFQDLVGWIKSIGSTC